ncbi:HD domain-containing phosphohydrolase [Neptuniibacter marinus]|uniref:HD domain-containing phosphohydrolase n=1 Tax=Neptuniibacter marinus TaxID=1806670 RepID=UPI003B5A5FF8
MKRILTTGFISLTLIFMICMLLINRFTENQQTQSIQHWQTTLSALADNQSLSATRWMFSTEAPLKEIADNNSVRLYLQRLTGKTSAEQEKTAQIDYLRNLIIAAANREGYTDKTRSSVNANLRVIANSSLALYDANLKPIAGTPGLAPINKEIHDTIKSSLSVDTVAATHIWMNENQTSQIAFVSAITGLPQFGAEGKIIGYLVGIKNAEKELYSLLRNYSVELQSLESALLQKKDEGLVYASPLRQDKSSALAKVIPMNGQSAAALAFNAPGQFIQAKDYRGIDVLAVSRNIASTNLKLIIKVDRNDALGQSAEEQANLQMMLVLGTLALLAMLVAAGWYGHLLKEQKSNKELRTTALALKEKTSLLDAINNNVIDMVMIVDTDINLVFINHALASKVSINPEDSEGKNLNSVLGSHYAEQLSPLIKECFESQKDGSYKKSLELQGTLSTFVISLVPMLYGDTASVMLHFHDITLIEQHQKRQTQLLRQIMQSLMNAIDLHDPYSAKHSQKTATIALAVADAMALEENDRASLEIAANLCNLGKLSIPQSLLTKTEPLTDQERDIVQNEVQHTREILQNIEFDGPVLETILQKHEYLDGSGSNGISGDELLLNSRILTTVNDFVAMISPRAYRDSLPVEMALAIILNDAGKRYDRQVVASLFHVAENKIDFDIL